MAGNALRQLEALAEPTLRRTRQQCVYRSLSICGCLLALNLPCTTSEVRQERRRGSRLMSSGLASVGTLMESTVFNWTTANDRLRRLLGSMRQPICMLLLTARRSYSGNSALSSVEMQYSAHECEVGAHVGGMGGMGGCADDSCMAPGIAQAAEAAKASVSDGARERDGPLLQAPASA